LHSTTQTLENIQQNHDDGLKLKTKPRRRRKSISSKSRRRRTSSGAEPGGEGKQGARHHHQQATTADNNTFVAQLQASGRIDHLTAPHC
jgi:hypothetical protein